MSDLVRITDVSPRDGLQNEPGVIPTADKVKLVELLCKTGVDEIEVTSFVSAKWVPQLGDGAAVFESLDQSPLPEGGGWGKGVPARNPVAVERAKSLRAAMTGPERALWYELSGKRLNGFKFRRQHPFGPYILDFYCPAERLVVEVDGESHNNHEAAQHDARRTSYLERHGLRVIRFQADDVVKDSAEVASRILRCLLAPQKSTPFPQPPPSGRGLQKAIFSALVPNERGMQSALDVNKAARRRFIRKVSVFTAASETFCKKNINATIDESLDRFRPVISAAHLNGLDVRAYISCVIACPFEGPIAPAVVADVAKRLMDLGVDEIDYGDTIGAGTSESTAMLLKEVRNVVPIEGGRVLSTLHLHDTFGRAAECVRAALDFGVRSFDGSVAGLGGCPYASKTLPDGTIQRAPGNISTELLVRTNHEAGYKTNVDLEALNVAAAFAREIVARSRAGVEKGGA
ncbi:MAG: DUF559 domain-containing protein [Phycisphaeraceae bacterium]|nr:DUF559 domain-containing protein [Phycisphaeraceae bacterium]